MLDAIKRCVEYANEDPLDHGVPRYVDRAYAELAAVEELFEAVRPLMEDHHSPRRLILAWEALAKLGG